MSKAPKIMHVCASCWDGTAESCCYPSRDDLRVAPDGAHLCEGCYEDWADAGERYDWPKRWSELPVPPEYAPTGGFDLVAHLHRQRAFSARTFGPGRRTEGVSDHIRKELGEIAKDPADLFEWIDVIMLGCDGAWRAGHEPEAIAAALGAKLAKNEARTWPDWRTADPNKAIEHDRTADAATA